MPRRCPFRWLALLSVLAFSTLAPRAPLAAQTPAAPPRAPDGTYRAAESDAGFDEWRRSRPALEILEPRRIPLGRYQMIVRSALAREPLDLADSLHAALDACAERMEFTEQTRMRLVARHAWTAFDSVAAGQPLVSITIVPSDARPAGCAGTPQRDVLLLEHAIFVGLDTMAHQRNDVAAVAVRVGSAPMTPAILAHAAITKIAPDAFVGGNGLSAIRIYLRFDDLGRVGDQGAALTLDVFNGLDARPETLVLPRSVMDELWMEILPWRARRLSAVSVSAALPESIPQPRDAELREARREYDAGTYADATERALTRLLTGDELTGLDRTNARWQAGVSFAALGDEAAARQLMRRAVTDEPCLRSGDGAPTIVRETLEENRPLSRCSAIPSGSVFALALVPGLAHRRLEPHRRASGLYPALFVAVGTVGAIVLQSSANSLYDEYRRDSSTPHHTYNAAQSRRSLANGVAITTWAAWGGSIAHAMFIGRRQTQRLDALEGFEVRFTR